ncbi:MAG: cation:proton antiporter [Saprospiraceae bacterium]|nr:MAG: cation:proton antiporter [Saprospiraceae bacterium]
MFLTLFDWTLPVHNPVFLLSILLLIVLAVPALLQRIRIPGMVGLIVAGAILGPNGVNLLERGEGIQLLGSAGLLYIMFWAGLEINMTSLLQNKHKSLVFGLLTFSLPLALGGLCSFYLLGFDWMAALLLASMFSTHTLISYPIVNRLHITQNEAVTTTVGGTIITDTLALLLLTVVSSSVQGTIDGWFWGKLALSLAAFVLVVFGVLPIVARWFFQWVGSDLTHQLVFALALVFLCGVMAEVAGVEAIIGAFMAGLVLNRLIPHTSPLMNRIELVGNALFIPAFLFSVGMLVNLNVFFQGEKAIVTALTLTAIALLTKWAAARATQKIFRYTASQGRLVFGLSSSHAGATIAIVLIGFQIKLFDEPVLNSAIFLILVTCTVSTFVTDRAARKIAAESAAAPPVPEKMQRILVPYANPSTVANLVDFAILLKAPGNAEPVYPLSIVFDDEYAKEEVLQNQRLIGPALQHAKERQITLTPIHRVDVSLVSGILRASKEFLATDLVIGWRPKLSPTEKLFGSMLDNLLSKAPECVFVTHFMRLPFSYSGVKAVIPAKSHLEPGFGEIVERLEYVCLHLNAPLQLFASPEMIKVVKSGVSKKMAGRVQAKSMEAQNWWKLHAEMREDDLLILVSARSSSISHEDFMEKTPGYLAAHFTGKSFVLAFPSL